MVVIKEKNKKIAPRVGYATRCNIEQQALNNKYVHSFIFRMASKLINSLQGRHNRIIIGAETSIVITYRMNHSLSLSLSVTYAMNHTRGMSRERQALGVGVNVLPKMKRKRESLKALSSIRPIVHRAPMDFEDVVCVKWGQC